MEAARGTEGTFGELIDSYLASLEGKASYSSAKSYLNTHIKKTWKGLLKIPAKDITLEECKQIARKAAEAGLTGGCNNLIAHIKAMFNFAIKSENSPVPSSTRFYISTNPADALAKNPDWVRVNTEYVSLKTLQTLYESCEHLKHDKALSKDKRHMNLARACQTQFLCLTGQRPEQVGRCRWEDFDEEKRTLLIRNDKNKHNPNHLVPLTDRAICILNRLRPYSGAGEYIFSNDRGQSAVSTGGYAKELQAHQRYYGLEVHAPKLIRSSWATLTSEAELPIEACEMVQSHIVGSKMGARHYDKSHYLPQKRKALEGWEQYFFKNSLDDTSSLSTTRDNWNFLKEQRRQSNTICLDYDMQDIEHIVYKAQGQSVGHAREQLSLFREAIFFAASGLPIPDEYLWLFEVLTEILCEIESGDVSAEFALGLSKWNRKNSNHIHMKWSEKSALEKGEKVIELCESLGSYSEAYNHAVDEGICKSVEQARKLRLKVLERREFEEKMDLLRKYSVDEALKRGAVLTEKDMYRIKSITKELA